MIGSSDVEVKVFSLFFKRDDIKSYFYTNGYNSMEMGKVLKMRKWVMVKVKSLRRREWTETQLERLA